MRVNWEYFDHYGKNDLEYKDQARAMLTKSLGFEPPVRLSVLGELTLRRLLRKIDNGENKQENLKYQLEVHTNHIKNWIPEYAPEYSHLLNKQP